MSTTSRVTIPEEFYDKTSDMLLQQPEPQYPFAQLFISAVGASLPTESEAGFDGREVRGVNADYISVDRDRLELARALPGELFAVKHDFQAGPGNTIRINRPKYINTVYTDASRRVSSGQTISTTAVNPESEQTSLTLFKYAGPVDPLTNRPAPYAVEKFDASMGVHNLVKILGVQLVRDYHRFLDSQYVGFGDLGTVIYPDGMTADNDATTPGSFQMALEQVSRTEQSMDEANLPTLPDGSRVLILTPQEWKQLKHDPEYEAQAAFHKEFDLLFPNYVGSVGKFHIFKSTTLLQPLNSSSVAVHHGIALAPGAFMGGMGGMPRIASSTDDNYAETAKIIWMAYLAFGVADARFIRSVRSA